jgi:hypothetical protein
MPRDYDKEEYYRSEDGQVVLPLGMVKDAAGRLPTDPLYEGSFRSGSVVRETPDFIGRFLQEQFKSFDPPTVTAADLQPPAAPTPAAPPAETPAVDTPVPYLPEPSIEQPRVIGDGGTTAQLRKLAEQQSNLSAERFTVAADSQREQAQILDAGREAQERHRKQQEEIYAKFDAEVQKHTAAAEQIAKKLGDAKIDPNRYYRDRPAFSSILMGIAVALDDIRVSRGMARSNESMELIQRGIDRSLKVQEAEIEKLAKEYTMEQGLASSAAARAAAKRAIDAQARADMLQDVELRIKSAGLARGAKEADIDAGLEKLKLPMALAQAEQARRAAAQALEIARIKELRANRQQGLIEAAKIEKEGGDPVEFQLRWAEAAGRTDDVNRLRAVKQLQAIANDPKASPASREQAKAQLTAQGFSTGSGGMNLGEDFFTKEVIDPQDVRKILGKDISSSTDSVTKLTQQDSAFRSLVTELVSLRNRMVELGISPEGLAAASNFNGYIASQLKNSGRKGIEADLEAFAKQYERMSNNGAVLLSEKTDVLQGQMYKILASKDNIINFVDRMTRQNAWAQPIAERWRRHAAATVRNLK